MKEYPNIKMRSGHYSGATTIVWCFDNRTTQALQEFVSALGIKDTYDSIILGGSIKSIASPAQESDRSFALDQIKTSVQLHHSTKVILMAHDNCGGYGGVKGKEFYLAELEKARNVVKTALPDIPVEMVFVGFDGTIMLP